MIWDKAAHPIYNMSNQRCIVFCSFDPELFAVFAPHFSLIRSLIGKISIENYPYIMHNHWTLPIPTISTRQSLPCTQTEQRCYLIYLNVVIYQNKKSSSFVATFFHHIKHLSQFFLMDLLESDCWWCWWVWVIGFLIGCCLFELLGSFGDLWIFRSFNKFLKLFFGFPESFFGFFKAFLDFLKAFLNFLKAFLDFLKAFLDFLKLFWIF